MANEWTIVELYGANNDGEPRRYEILADASISVGQLLELSGDRVASAAVVGTRYFAGVALEEHVPGKGETTISAWTDGIFEVVTSGAITIGNNITGGGVLANTVNVAESASGAHVLGYALKAAAAGDTITVRLRL